MTVVIDVGLVLVGLAAGLCVAAILRRPSLVDRVVALETLLVTAAAGIALLAMRTATAVFLPVLIVVALVGFAGAVTVARFIERRGA